MPFQLPLLSTIETSLKVLALLGAGVFFAWKLRTGWLIANVKLTVTGTREAKDETADFLAIALSVEKGSTDSVWLKHAAVRVTPQGEAAQTPMELGGFRRLSLVKGKLDWNALDQRRTGWAISPGEVLQIGTCCEVPASKPALIEAAIFAERPLWWPGFQWRATAVSLPRPKK